MLAKLKENNEKYRDIEIEIIDEDVSPKEAAAYQYRLVPNFWVGGEKALEGIPKIDSVQAVLDKALEGDDSLAEQATAQPATEDSAEKPGRYNERYETEDTPKESADPAKADTRLPEDLPEAPVVKDLSRDQNH